ncbi:MAG TPA: MBL fold metallo-hydrolase [Methyloceanibacter sp.]|jgi:glyoxylase-like metal-dependent hydrolase (beta-lactamase superfamily II)|nr:MBL fold metallo-hydrolase [Methyloceanibacter sp.]
MSAELAFNRSVDVDYGVAQKVAPDVRRIVANNPGPYTFLGTNTYVVGSGQVAVVDPGPADEDHLKAIAGAIKGERLTHILVTHSHHDHCDGAKPLQAMLGGEIVAYGPTGTARGAGAPGLGDAFVDPSFVPDRVVRDGDTVKGKGFALDVLHMPGHAPDHLCFALVGRRTMFTGDHVMGWNTTVIAPPEGNLADFIASLERLMARHDKLFLPGHGGRIQTPQRVVRAYITHRKWREQTILACLDDGVSTIPGIVGRLYGTLDTELKEAAALSVRAHLEHLTARNLVRAESAGDRLEAGDWLEAVYVRVSS